MGPMVSCPQLLLQMVLAGVVSRGVHIFHLFDPEGHRIEIWGKGSGLKPTLL